MTNQSTIDKLIEMHMTSMADAFRNQMQDISMEEIPFDDRFGMIVDIEYTSRKNSRLKRLIKNAEFEQPDATIAAVDYGHNRKVNRHLIERLATCEYITEYRNIFITGATGSGKTYLACAFGMEACKRYYSVKYVRVPDLLLDLQEARDEGRFKDALKKYTNPTIFCSQYLEEDWYQKLGGKDNPLTDAIMDRISFDSYKIPIMSLNPEKDISMREVYGLDPSQAQ